MLSTYLAAYPWLAPTMLGIVVIVGPLVAWWLASWRTASGVLAAVAAAAVGALTLWPTPRDGIASGCAIDWDLRLWAPEPLANVVLLVPVTLLLAVAMRQPVLAALIGAAFAGAIELTQALVPDLGRACDTSDWAANAAGAVLGAVLAGIGLWLSRSSDGRRPEHAQGRTRR